MGQRRGYYFLAAAVLVLVVFFKFWNTRPGDQDVCVFEGRKAPAELEYVEHATCRMRCREIDRALVEDVYSHGIVNCDKSDADGSEHGNPRWALEMEDQGRGRVRIIIEDDHGKHLVITAIRLGEKDKCECS